MTSDRDHGPTVAELRRLIREQVKVEFILTNGQNVAGKIKWFDDQAFSIVPDGEESMTIFRSSVVGYRLSNGGKAKKE